MGGIWPRAAATMAMRLRPMPARTLWRAIARERRPTWSASATRSIRSTVITTSAASVETVGGLLDRARSLDHDARARRPRHAAHEGDRRGEDQRAR